ncbi:hypothetical protein ACFL17_10000 [Pseudomonadota bacterium]
MPISAQKIAFFFAVTLLLLPLAGYTVDCNITFTLTNSSNSDINVQRISSGVKYSGFSKIMDGFNVEAGLSNPTKSVSATMPVKCSKERRFRVYYHCASGNTMRRKYTTAVKSWGKGDHMAVDFGHLWSLRCIHEQ